MKKRNTEFKSLLEYCGFSRADKQKYPVISGALKQLTPRRTEK